MKRRSIRTTCLLLAVFLASSLALYIWFARTVHQQRLDRDLIAAVKKCDAHAVTSLLDRGANANATDKPYKPITLKGQLTELLRRLRLQTGAVTGPRYASALSLTYSIVRYTSPDQSFIDIFHTHLGTTGVTYDSGQPPKDPYEIVSALFNHGATLGSDDESGSNLLAYACMCDHAKTIELLLQHHADPNAELSNGIELLFRPLMCTDDYKCIRLLLEHGANVNAIDRGRPARLMYVYDPYVYQLLFDHGADPNIQDDQGETALILLFKNMFLPDANIVSGTRFLLGHGATVSIKDKSGRTALDYARGRRREYASQEEPTSKFDAESIRLLESAIKREQAQIRRPN